MGPLLSDTDFTLLQAHHVQIEIDAQDHAGIITIGDRRLKISVLRRDEDHPDSWTAHRLAQDRIEETAKKVAVMLLKKELLQGGNHMPNFAINALGIHLPDRSIQHEDLDHRKNTRKDYNDLVTFLKGPALSAKEESKETDVDPFMMQGHEADEEEPEIPLIHKRKKHSMDESSESDGSAAKKTEPAFSIPPVKNEPISSSASKMFDPRKAFQDALNTGIRDKGIDNTHAGTFLKREVEVENPDVKSKSPFETFNLLVEEQMIKMRQEEEEEEAKLLKKARKEEARFQAEFDRMEKNLRQQQKRQEKAAVLTSEPESRPAKFTHSVSQDEKTSSPVMPWLSNLKGKAINPAFIGPVVAGASKLITRRF